MWGVFISCVLFCLLNETWYYPLELKSAELSGRKMFCEHTFLLFCFCLFVWEGACVLRLRKACLRRTVLPECRVMGPDISKLGSQCWCYPPFAMWFCVYVKGRGWEMAPSSYSVPGEVSLLPLRDMLQKQGMISSQCAPKNSSNYCFLAFCPLIICVPSF